MVGVRYAFFPTTSVLVKAGVAFRGARTGDYPGICRMIQDAEELFLVHDKGVYPFTVPQLEQLLERRLEPTVMLFDDVLVGFANFYRLREKEAVFIGNLIVEAGHRGRGLGRQLMLHMIDRAFIDHDLPEVKIHVYSRNTAGLLLYTRMGFLLSSLKVMKDYMGSSAVRMTLSLTRPSGSVDAEEQNTEVRHPTE